MDITRIKSLAEKFTENTLGDECPMNMCFTACFPLFLHLRNNCIENTIVTGICENRRHFWIQLKDKTIIDPTVKQFNFGKNLSLVYIGEKTDNYNEDIVVVDWFNSTCEVWVTPFCDTENYFSGGTTFNLSAAFKLNSKAAIIISNEIDELGIDIFQSTEYVQYFSSIKKILENHPNEQEYLDFSKHKDFDKLLKKLLNYRK